MSILSISPSDVNSYPSMQISGSKLRFRSNCGRPPAWVGGRGRRRSDELDVRRRRSLYRVNLTVCVLLGSQVLLAGRVQ